MVVGEFEFWFIVLAFSIFFWFFGYIVCRLHHTPFPNLGGFQIFSTTFDRIRIPIVFNFLGFDRIRTRVPSKIRVLT